MFSAPSVIHATRTVEAINVALEKDQGRLYRKLLGEAIPHAKDAFRHDEESGFRSHLGASLVGRDCSRELWYTFRWFTDVRHKGRMLRLFNRGHLEEPRLVALLRMIGCEVWQHDEAGNQYRISLHNYHFGGSLDAVVRGCPDVAPGVAILGEFKTHNDKSFNKLVEEGVRSAKFEHFVQQQVYMHGYALPAALYLAVNKNDDELYGEIVPYDAEQAYKFCERGGLIVSNPKPPQKCNPSPGWYKCKFCDHLQTCHFNGEPARNCRTCIHSAPVQQGMWHCSFHNRHLSKEDQLKGCSDYRWIPT